MIIKRIATFLYLSRNVLAWTSTSKIHLPRRYSVKATSDLSVEATALPRFWTKRLSIPVPRSSQSLHNLLMGLGFDMSQIVSGSLIFPSLNISYPIYDGRLQLQLGVTIAENIGFTVDPGA